MSPIKPSIKHQAPPVTPASTEKKQRCKESWWCKEEKTLFKSGCALAGTANEVWRGFNWVYRLRLCNPFATLKNFSVLRDYKSIIIFHLEGDLIGSTEIVKCGYLKNALILESKCPRWIFDMKRHFFITSDIMFISAPRYFVVGRSARSRKPGLVQLAEWRDADYSWKALDHIFHLRQDKTQISFKS